MDIGQTVMVAIGIRLPRAERFNVPTFSDAYKVAALDAVDRLNELSGGAFECVA